MVNTLLALSLAIVFGTSVSAGFAASPAEQSVSDDAKTNLEKYEKFYRDTFRKDAIDKCVASAPKATAAGFDVSPTCACASDALLASKSLDQLIKFETDKAAKAELTAITAKCIKTNPPVQKAKAG